MDPDLTEAMMWLENTTLLRNYSPSLALSNCTQVDEVTLPGFELPPLDWLLTLKMVALIFMILLTIVGNLIVIVAVVRSPSLRSPTHALIINLAVADLLLGATVLPLSATREIVGVWLLGPELCSVWTTLDVLCCTASILSLCGISVDRYIGVSRPLAYSRIMTRRRVKVLIAAIWALALAISVAPPLGWREAEGVVEAEESECHVNKQLGYVIFSACGSFYLPALVILVLYALVYRAAIRHSKFLDSGSRVTRSEVTLRVHTGPSRAGSLREPNAVRDKDSTAHGITGYYYSGTHRIALLMESQDITTQGPTG
uniref:(California timema) hypothetical protein n=1 Tax=Timema californicum TaxID=61474 RepID=A0A7R9P7U6_TIMCA|nr:unnamed protein product [Timema californicum]